MRLQDELVTLRLECTNLYRKGHFTSLELVPPSTLTTTHLKAEPLTKGTHSSSTSWFRKPMTRAELVSISSSEDEGNLRFVYELLSWVEEMQVGVCSRCLYSALRCAGSSSLFAKTRLLRAPCINSLNHWTLAPFSLNFKRWISANPHNPTQNSIGFSILKPFGNSFLSANCTLSGSLREKLQSL